MDDQELIAAVAKKAGWTELSDEPAWMDPEAPIQVYGLNPQGRLLPLPPWRTSVDAALGVLSGNAGLVANIEYSPHYSSVALIDDNHDEPFASAGDKSLPRAILLAWLEA